MTTVADIIGELEKSDGRKILKSYLDEEFGGKFLDKFDAITALYLDFNAVINISALKTYDDIYIKHYLDSIAAHKYIIGDCCDVGCGGGFPCIPLATVTANNYLGIDGVGKKLGFIDMCADKLGMLNIKSRHSRAEELKNTPFRFDTVCARAVADADKVLRYCAPIAKPGGRVVLYKTQSDDTVSDQTLKKTKCKLDNIVDYTLYNTDIKRRLLIYSVPV